MIRRRAGRLPLATALSLVVACNRPRPDRPQPPADRAVSLVGAVRADSVDAIRQLLAVGVAADTIAPDGTRPLTEAARHGRVAATALLLEAGARLDLPDASGARPIDYAVAQGHRQIAAMLTRQAARAAGVSAEALAWFDAVSRQSGRLPTWHRVLDGEAASLGLVYAVLMRRDDGVRALRRTAGLTNQFGYPALAVAARFGSEEAVKILLHAGAAPDAEASAHFHETALMEAARDGYVSIARRLLRAGAHVDRVDDRAETALMWAVRAGETDYGTVLLAAGARPGRRNRAGQTALDIARQINHADLIALLEQRPARN